MTWRAPSILRAARPPRPCGCFPCSIATFLTGAWADTKTSIVRGEILRPAGSPHRPGQIAGPRPSPTISILRAQTARDGCRETSGLQHDGDAQGCARAVKICDHGEPCSINRRVLNFSWIPNVGLQIGAAGPPAPENDRIRVATSGSGCSRTSTFSWPSARQRHACGCQSACSGPALTGNPHGRCRARRKDRDGRYFAR